MDFIIIVAGGSGTRMGSDIPKQFLEVDNKPILMHTIERFREYSAMLNIIVVLPREQQDYWKELCNEHDFNIMHTIVSGGATRFQSVKNALKLIPDDEQGLVGIHDGVRPFVSLDLIERCYKMGYTDSTAVPILPITDSLRYLGEGGETHNVNRNDYYSVQTPQVFNVKLIKTAYKQRYRKSFTDDASVVENTGCCVNLVEGDVENIKITTPLDLLFADTLIQIATIRDSMNSDMFDNNMPLLN